MAAMLIDNHKQTVMDLLREGEVLLQRIGDQENAQKLEVTRREAGEKRSPTIMFYGLYNAGKSTLINALCQSNIAPTGDVPTTAAVQTVPWEGYTLIDTPGINVHAEHTEIAEKGIRQSDVILFVMDNADTFDNAIVYQAIVDILKMGKPLAIVVNQKNVDEEEDPNTPVPDQPSMRRIVGKVSSNLEVQGARNGRQIAGKSSNFLGIFPVNAFTAYSAKDFPTADGELLYAASGVLSLRNALNESIRRSQFVYILRTPLINLRDILREAMKAYQSAAIYGEKQQSAEDREHLLESRQRLRDRLMADGLRKIESAIEQMKRDAAHNQDISGVNEKLNEDLMTLVQQVAGEEQDTLRGELSANELPAYAQTDSSALQGAAANASDTGDALLGFGAAAMTIPPIVITPIPLPINYIIAAVASIAGILSKLFASDKPDPQAVSQEQQANYYKWVNELRDYEIQVKANYEKCVNDLVQQYYEPKLNEINRFLMEMDETCAEHTRNLRAMEQLLIRVGDEMTSLPEAM